MKRRDMAENKDKYDQMIKLFKNAESKQDLEGIAMMFILDMSSPRSDIALALKETEIDKGW